MTQREICSTIIKQKGCYGLSCRECALKSWNCTSHATELALKWLEVHPLITDQIIQDIISVQNESYVLTDVKKEKMKKQLQEKGYEVEEDIVKKAQNYELKIVDNDKYCCADVQMKIALYAQAIYELEKKIKDLEKL